MIKFRGKRLSDGQTIYGCYHERGGDAYIDDWRVDPDSAAQLCGYDRNGAEVYDGEVVFAGIVLNAALNFFEELSSGK